MLGTRFKILITITSNSEDLTKPNIQRETYIDPTLRLHNVMNHKYSIRAEAAAILAKRIIPGPWLLREIPFSNPPHDDQSKLSWVERVQKGIKKGGAATYSPSLFHRNHQNQNQNQIEIKIKINQIKIKRGGASLTLPACFIGILLIIFFFAV